MKKLRITSLVLLIIFMASCAPVQPVSTLTMPPQPTVAPVRPTTWPDLRDGWMTFKGMPSINNRVVYDPNGYLWATSSEVVLRWNIQTGEFTQYTGMQGLPKSISGITYYDGKIWVSANDGNIAYFSHDKWVKQVLASDYLYSFFQTGDRLWISGSKDLYFFDGQVWHTFDQFPESEKKYIYQVAKSKDGSLWFQNQDTVFKFNGVTWQKYDNLGYATKWITTSDGTLYFIYSDLVTLFDGTTLAPLILPGDYYRYYIQNAFLTGEGKLWLQTDKGTFIVQDRDVKAIPFAGFGDLSDKKIYTPIGLTPQGWLFSSNTTVYLYNEKDWKEYSLAPGSSIISWLVGNDIVGFAPDGALWSVNHNGQLTRYNGEKTETLPGYLGYGLKSRIDSSGNIWSIYPQSSRLILSKMGQDESTTFELHFPASDLALAQDDTLWLAFSDGFIARFFPDDPQNKYFIDLEKIKIGGELVNYPLRPSRIEVGSDGTVYVFAINAGLYGYDGEAWKYYGLSQLGNSNAFAIDSQGSIWAGFPYNLFKYDGDKWVNYWNNCICPSGLVTAPDNALWFISGCAGVYRFDEVDWTPFEREDELNGVVPSKILVAPDGALWFFSDQGWARYKP